MPLRKLTPLLLFLTLRAVTSGFAADGTAVLISGPMVADATTTSAKIWIETDRPAEFRVNYWTEPRLLFDPTVPEPISRGSVTARTADDFPHTGVAMLENLGAGRLVHYDIEVDGRPVRALSPQVFSLFPPQAPDRKHPDEPGNFTVAFGSCDFPARIPIQPIWAQVARRRPVAFLFLGDNNYMPDDPEAFSAPEDDVRHMMADNHRSLRSVGGLRDIMASTPCYAIWDDHDFGPGDSDRTFKRKEVGLEIFKRYWPNPRNGGDSPGVQHSFRVGDVEFFMLDDRFHRDPDEAPDRSTMLGSRQLQWLKDSLKASEATFKVIACGGTMLVDEGKETWQRYGSERDDFLKWMFAEGIDGVFFIAGDWHIGVLNRLNRPGFSYPLYELLSSNLAVKIIPRDRVELAEGTANNQWVSKRYTGYNFGVLRFTGERGGRSATLQIVDDTGEVQADLTLRESDLRAAGGKPKR